MQSPGKESPPPPNPEAHREAHPAAHPLLVKCMSTVQTHPLLWSTGMFSHKHKSSADAMHNIEPSLAFTFLF